MSDRLPSFDAGPPTAPAAKAPLPPESPVHQFADGVVRCNIATPYLMGSTNCWLVVGDEDVLCVDPGADAGAAVEHITSALAPFGRTVRDIRTIVVTHTHLDHCGAAAGLAEASDATVAVGALEVDRLGGEPRSTARLAAVWRSFGTPPHELNRAVKNEPVDEPVARHRLRALHDGARVQAGGRAWRVYIVAGHSPGHVMLVADDMILAGDQLMANVLPAVHFGPHDDATRTRSGVLWAPSVAEYLASMQRFEGLDSMTVLPGHGDAFLGTARPVERGRRYHRARCQLVRARLAARGPTTVWDLALEMYAGLVTADGIDRRFASAAAEIAGRLEALVHAGRATFTRRDDVIVFAPV